MQGSHAFWKIFFLGEKKEKRKPKHCFTFLNLGLTLDLTFLWSPTERTSKSEIYKDLREEKTPPYCPKQN